MGVLIWIQGVAARQCGKDQPTSTFFVGQHWSLHDYLLTSQAADAMSYYITTSTPENTSHFLLFKKGEEPGFNYVYTHLYKPVLYYANRITGDEFANHTIVQEAFLRAWQFWERMTSILHLFRFIRLCTRWGCYDYFRQPSNGSIGSLSILNTLRIIRQRHAIPIRKKNMQTFPIRSRKESTW